VAAWTVSRPRELGSSHVTVSGASTLVSMIFPPAVALYSCGSGAGS
jgi:hypothetical protein